MSMRDTGVSLRDVQIEPEEVRRPDAPPAEPHDEAGAADRGGEENVRWLTAGDPPSDDR
jgi:hypothetical protein